MTLHSFILTIFVTLQFVLAPVAQLDPCWIAEVLGVESCCCQSIEDVPEASGCCAPEQTAPRGNGEDRKEPADDCGCVTVPGGIPTQPLPHSLADPLELPVSWVTEPALRSGQRITARRLLPTGVSPPGPGRSLLVLHQVFRL